MLKSAIHSGIYLLSASYVSGRALKVTSETRSLFPCIPYANEKRQVTLIYVNHKSIASSNECRHTKELNKGRGYFGDGMVGEDSWKQEVSYPKSER